MTTRTTIEARLAAGDLAAQIAADMRLDYDEEHDAVVLPGWTADDGSQDVDYPNATSGFAAAESYVADGDWGEITQSDWHHVTAWRVGIRVELPECASCTALATSHDEEGDLACDRHAASPAAGVALAPFTGAIGEVRLYEESHTVEIKPEVPECGDGEDHDWQTPFELVGGLEENPGVFGHGGGALIHEACVRCGCGRTTDTWAQNRETGEQGLTGVSYEAGKYDVA